MIIPFLFLKFFNNAFSGSTADARLKKKLDRGDYQYRWSSYCWTVTKTAEGFDGSLHKLNAVVSNPPGPAPAAGKNQKWIVTSVTANKSRNDNRWQIVIVYETRDTTDLPQEVSSEE